MKKLFIAILCIVNSITFGQVIHVYNEPASKQEGITTYVADSLKNVERSEQNKPGSVNFLGQSGASYSNNLPIPEVNIVSVSFYGEKNKNIDIPLNILSTLPILKPSNDQDERSTIEILSPTGGVINANFSFNWINKLSNDNFGFVFQPTVKLVQCKSKDGESMKFFGNSNIIAYVSLQKTLFDNKKNSAGILFAYIGIGYNFSYGGDRDNLFNNDPTRDKSAIDFGCYILKAGVRINQTVDLSIGYVKAIREQIGLPRNELFSLSTNLRLKE